MNKKYINENGKIVSLNVNYLPESVKKTLKEYEPLKNEDIPNVLKPKRNVRKN